MDGTDLKIYAKIVRLLDPDSLREKTRLLRENFERDRNPSPVKLTKAQERRQEISNLIADNFGCQSSAVRQLVELMEGCTLPQPRSGEGLSVEPVVGAVMVENDDDTSLYMSYNIDSDGDVIVLKVDGDHGGYFSPGATDWRPGTEEEVESYIEETRHLVSDVD